MSIPANKKFKSFEDMQSHWNNEKKERNKVKANFVKENPYKIWSGDNRKNALNKSKSKALSKAKK